MFSLMGLSVLRPRTWPSSLGNSELYCKPVSYIVKFSLPKCKPRNKVGFFVANSVHKLIIIKSHRARRRIRPPCCLTNTFCLVQSHWLLPSFVSFFLDCLSASSANRPVFSCKSLNLDDSSAVSSAKSRSSSSVVKFHLIHLLLSAVAFLMTNAIPTSRTPVLPQTLS